MANQPTEESIFFQIARRIGDKGILIAVLLVAMIYCLNAIKTVWIASIAWLVAFVYLLFIFNVLIKEYLNPRASSGENSNPPDEP